MSVVVVFFFCVFFSFFLFFLFFFFFLYICSFVYILFFIFLGKGLILLFCIFSCNSCPFLSRLFFFVVYLWCICLVIIVNKLEVWWQYLPPTLKLLDISDSLPPPPYDLENYLSNLHHIIHVHFTKCFRHVPIGFFTAISK